MSNSVSAQSIGSNRYELLVDPIDADLQTRVGIALSLSSNVAVRALRYEVKHQVVTLRGQLASSAERRLAIESVRRIAGVLSVHSRLVVAEERFEAPADAAPRTVPLQRWIEAQSWLRSNTTILGSVN